MLRLKWAILVNGVTGRKSCVMTYKSLHKKVINGKVGNILFVSMDGLSHNIPQNDED